MKLLFCTQCGDTLVLKFGVEEECRCKQTKGFYCSENLAIVNEHGFVFAINNNSLKAAAIEWLKHPEKGENIPIEAYSIPRPMEGHVKVRPNRLWNDFNWKETLQREAQESAKVDYSVGGDRTSALVPMQTEGGSEILVEPEITPDGSGSSPAP